MILDNEKENKMKGSDLIKLIMDKDVVNKEIAIMDDETIYNRSNKNVRQIVSITTVTETTLEGDILGIISFKNPE